MSGEPTCPHCGESLGESIPGSVQDPINIQCPICGMNYTYYRNEREASDQEQYYFSTGLHRRHPVDRESRDSFPVMSRSCLVGLCCIGVSILFVMLLIIETILRFFDWFGY